MRDGWVESFDLGSPYAYDAHRWQRYEHEPPILNRKSAAIAVAGIFLLGFVATDVAVFQNETAPVQVTFVNWYTEGQLFATSHGFTVHTSQVFNLTVTCTGLCYRFNGALVESPFHLVSTQIYYYPTEFLNVTAQAPSTGYSGPLSVTLTVG